MNPGAGSELSGGTGPGFDSPFVVTPIVVADADRALGALFEAVVRASRTVESATARRLGRLADDLTRLFGERRDRVGRALVARDAALDAAADLVECADALAREGCLLEAFAFEGIEARLVESLVGSGPDASG